MNLIFYVIVNLVKINIVLSCIVVILIYYKLYWYILCTTWYFQVDV